jgi:precorrin-2 dehydrogenase/sirohydrochlorin ferrochelatase
MLDVGSRNIVIVGGGEVAARKARGLIEAGATSIRCVSPNFCPQFPVAVTRSTEAYRAAHLEGASIVFAATDQPEVNRKVVQDAHARNIWVSRVDPDEEEPGDFAVPAMLRRGEMVIAVSAHSPALASKVRDRLEESFDPQWEMMAAAMRSLRPWIKSAVPDIENRRVIFRLLATEEAMNVLHSRGEAGLRAWLMERHPELTHA